MLVGTKGNSDVGHGYESALRGWLGVIGRCWLLALFAVDRPEKEKVERDATRQGLYQCRWLLATGRK